MHDENQKESEQVVHITAKVSERERATCTVRSKVIAFTQSSQQKKRRKIVQMPGNKKWIKINEWRRQQTKIKMNIEFVRFAYVYVSVSASIVDCWCGYGSWSMVLGAGVFCMPHMKRSKSKASAVVLLERLHVFIFQHRIKVPTNDSYCKQLVVSLCFACFSSFPFSCQAKTHFARYEKAKSLRNAGAFSIYECVLCYICPCISLIADNTSVNANTRKGYKISSFVSFLLHILSHSYLPLPLVLFLFFIFYYKILLET